jgi:hypothetical protein
MVKLNGSFHRFELLNVRLGRPFAQGREGKGGDGYLALDHRIDHGSQNENLRIAFLKLMLFVIYFNLKEMNKIQITILIQSINSILQIYCS